MARSLFCFLHMQTIAPRASIAPRHKRGCDIRSVLHHVCAVTSYGGSVLISLCVIHITCGGLFFRGFKTELVQLRAHAAHSSHNFSSFWYISSQNVSMKPLKLISPETLSFQNELHSYFSLIIRYLCLQMLWFPYVASCSQLFQTMIL